MFNVYINKNLLYGIMTLAILVLVITIICFTAFIYHTKRKFDSINEYNMLVSDKLNTYKDNLEQYYKNMEVSGISTSKESIISKITKIVKIIRGSD